MVGYLFVLGYAFLLIFVLGNALLKRLKVEESRKMIHILLFGLWVIIDCFMQNTIHQVIVPFLFLIINICSYHFGIFKAIEREKDNHFGTIYFAMAILFIFFVAFTNDTFYLSTGIATICLTLGDGFAGLLGYRYGKRKIYHNKTIIGSISCLIFSFVGCILYKCFYWYEIKWYDLLIISVIVTIVEMVDWGLDNCTITLAAFYLSYVFRYYPSMELYVSVCISIAVFWVVYIAKAIDYYGALVSMVIVFCFTYFGKKEGIIFLLICYGCAFFISFFKKKYKKIDSLECESDGAKGKNVVQILANGGMGTIFVILYGQLQRQELLVVSLICIAGCLIDSISSDIGTLSKMQPYDFLKRKYVEKGLSGGVSWLGLISAAVVSIGLGRLIAIICNCPGLNWWLISVVIYSQTLIDTCLGSCVQVKRCCRKCGKITEKKRHCECETIYYAGIKWANNNVINIVSSILVSGLAYWIFAK